MQLSNEKEENGVENLKEWIHSYREHVSAWDNEHITPKYVVENIWFWLIIQRYNLLSSLYELLHNNVRRKSDDGA